jgi:hypothetical protein
MTHRPLIRPFLLCPIFTMDCKKMISSCKRVFYENKLKAWIVLAANKLRNKSIEVLTAKTFYQLLATTYIYAKHGCLCAFSNRVLKYKHKSIDSRMWLIWKYNNCSLSLWRVVRGSKLMHLDSLIHGLFTTLTQFRLLTTFISGNYYYTHT